MIDLSEGKHTGAFSVSPGRSAVGQLNVSGRKTLLEVSDADFIGLPSNVNFLHGTLTDHTKVTLVDCITFGPGTRFSAGGPTSHHEGVFPHYILWGREHVDPTTASIEEIFFEVQDAITLFYDFDAFGSVHGSPTLIRDVLQARRVDREVETGPNPQILYFSGKSEIFRVGTPLGQFSAHHLPSHTLGGPRGVALNNSIFCGIKFSNATTFAEALSAVWVYSRFLTLVAGRLQTIIRCRVLTNAAEHSVLNVYFTSNPSRPDDSDRDPQPADIPLNGGIDPSVFSSVLAEWVRNEAEYSDARLRFLNSYSEGSRYTIDRLVGAANMFDILPTKAVPPDVKISPELEAARDLSRGEFLKLPDSPERNMVLSALGRVGKSSLRRKIMHRSRCVGAASGGRLPDLDWVIEQAVICRNHYVHGSAAPFRYADHFFESVAFLTDTLEFIFGAADLIEAGWDLASWAKQGTTLSHPFSRLLYDYKERLAVLRRLCAP